MIVGGCTAIPFEYSVFGKKQVLGLIVDVFILEEYRYDPFALRVMYNKVKEALAADGITFIMAVPNKMAYPFWKQVVKWKDITHIPYFILPVRLGNLLHKTKLLNLFSLPFSYAWTGFFSLFSLLFSGKVFNRQINISRSPELYRYRFPEEYVHVQKATGDFITGCMMKAVF